MLQQTQVQDGRSPTSSVSSPRCRRCPRWPPHRATTSSRCGPGLGYYARARNLQAAAQRCVEQHDGELPRDIDALTALPGIGRSTAAAILSQAWGDRYAILDGNVKRVLCASTASTASPALPAVEKVVGAGRARTCPHARLADYTQAQMDLGRDAMHAQRSRLRAVPAAGRLHRAARRPHRRTADAEARQDAAAEVRTRAVARGRATAKCCCSAARPPAIWASLWTLPQADDARGARDWFEHELHAATSTTAGAAHDRPRLQPLQAAPATAALARRRAARARRRQ